MHTPFYGGKIGSLKPPESDLVSIGFLALGKIEKNGVLTLEAQYSVLFKWCKMQNLIGPIVKIAKIFNKNIFLPFINVV